MNANRLYSRRSFLSIAGALGAAALMSLAGCGSPSAQQSAANSGASASSEGASSSAATSSSAASAAATSSSPSSASSSSGKVLVAYFTGTGNTRTVAHDIADHTGGDLFEVTPKDPYTNEDLNFNNTDSRVDREYDGRSSRDIPLAQSAPDNFDDYDVVFIGYPIWWSDAAWPIRHFVSDNDFKGKTVIPFCTSLSSPLGSSASNLEKLSNGGTWGDGHRFGEQPKMSEVDAWVDSLDL